MALIRDSRLGPYEIAALGAGGIGEVYRTSDNAEAITQIYNRGLEERPRRVIAVAVLLATALSCSCVASHRTSVDLAGDWQGTLKEGPQTGRLLVRIERAKDLYRATIFSIDQSLDWGVGTPANAVTFAGSTLRISVDTIESAFEGTVSADGSSINGTWSQNGGQPLAFRRATTETAWRDASPHATESVTVDTGVRLEVLDWGGSGRAIVLLAGFGNTAHVFDTFAPKLTSAYRVYGITRRGFGTSSAATSGYSADRLGDDVLAVLDALKIDRPVLAGHSIAGQELSSVATRHPERIGGVIYLDAAYSYAFYDRARGDFHLDLLDLNHMLEQLRQGPAPSDPKVFLRELRESLEQFQRHVRTLEKQTLPPTSVERSSQAVDPVFQAIIDGQRKYSDIRVPALAIYAIGDPSSEAQAKAFEAGVSSARVVRLSGADHYVFQSNEADVLREINAFLRGLR